MSLSVVVENNRGSWSIEVLEGNMSVHKQGIAAVLGLALSALPAFDRVAGSTSQVNWWAASAGKETDG